LNLNPLFHVICDASKGFEQSTIERPRTWKGKRSSFSARFLLKPESFVPSEGVVEKPKAHLDLRLRNLARSLLYELVKELAKVYLISAPRGVISIETSPGSDPEWVGKNGQNLILILSKIYGRRKYESLQREISNWAERFGIGNIAAGLRKGSVLGADFEDPALKTVFDLASASYGSRQLLTIITQIFWSKIGSTLIIEEPEISLHPDSQMLILELFSKALKDGKQIICTTHSPFFILSLSRVIGKGELSKEDIAIYHVEKKEKGTKTRQLELNDRGFVKGWIPSYMESEDKLFDE
jgi:predicted ATPase